MFRLVIPAEAMQSALTEILGMNVPAISGRQPVTWLSLGISRGRDGMEFLAQRRSLRSPVNGEEAGVLLVWAVRDEAALYPEALDQAFLDERWQYVVGLAVGVGPLTGRARGWVRLGLGEVWPLDSVQVVGPGMPCLDLTGASGCSRGDLARWRDADGLYSRTVGAWTAETLTVLRRTRIAVIGAGGNGSLMAITLARFMGGGSRLALIDGDRLQAANLPAWGAPVSGVSGTQVGQPKVAALAAFLATMPDPPQVETVTGALPDWAALSLLRRYDLYVVCVDNAMARFAATYLAALYDRPLLDVATGVFLGGGPEGHARRMRLESEDDSTLPMALLAPGPRVMGADVRLMVPASHGGRGDCLLCAGGVGGDLSSRRDEGVGHPFYRVRAGSDYLNNSDAVSQGARVLLAFLSGAVEESVHYQMDREPDGVPVWRRVPITPPLVCPVCARAGRGDGALGEMEQAREEWLRLEAARQMHPDRGL